MNIKPCGYSILLLISYLLCGVESFEQAINCSVEERSKYLIHSTKWTTREKRGFQDGDNVIQVEKTGIRLQLAYTVRFDGTKHGIILHKIDGAGNEVKTNKLEGGEKVFGPVITEAKEFGRKILLFYFRYEDKDSMRLFGSEINKETLELVNTRQLFSYHQDNVGIFKLEKAMKPEINLFESVDKSKLLLAYLPNNEEMYTCVWDKDAGFIRQKTSRMTGMENYLVSDAAIDNAGNDVIAVGETEYYQGSLGSTKTKRIVLQRVNSPERITDVESWTGGIDIHNTSFKVSRDQSKFYAFGNYAGNTENEGFWVAEMVAEKGILPKPTVYNYPDDFKKRVRKTGFTHKIKHEQGVIDAKFQLAEFEDGGVAVVGIPMMEYTTDKYVITMAGPVMVVFLNGKAAPIFTMLPRSQGHCAGSGAIILPSHNKLVVIYNDYAKYLDEAITDNVNHVRAALINALTLAGAVISRDGTIESRKVLAEEMSRKDFFDLSEYDDLADGKLFIPSSVKDKHDDLMKAAVIVVE